MPTSSPRSTSRGGATTSSPTSSPRSGGRSVSRTATTSGGSRVSPGARERTRGAVNEAVAEVSGSDRVNIAGSIARAIFGRVGGVVVGILTPSPLGDSSLPEGINELQDAADAANRRGLTNIQTVAPWIETIAIRNDGGAFDVTFNSNRDTYVAYTARPSEFGPVGDPDTIPVHDLPPPPPARRRVTREVGDLVVDPAPLEPSEPYSPYDPDRPFREHPSPRTFPVGDPLIPEPGVRPAPRPRPNPRPGTTTEVQPGEVDLDVTVTRDPAGRPRLRVRTVTRRRWRRRRRDSKYSQIYMELMWVISTVWGPIDEARDFVDAVVWNTFREDGATAIVVEHGDVIAVLNGIIDGEYHVDIYGAAVSYAIAQGLDYFTGRLSRGAQDRFNAAGWHSERGVQSGFGVSGIRGG